jgi:hypothetical protein
VDAALARRPLHLPIRPIPIPHLQPWIKRRRRGEARTLPAAQVRQALADVADGRVAGDAGQPARWNFR